MCVSKIGYQLTHSTSTRLICAMSVLNWCVLLHRTKNEKIGETKCGGTIREERQKWKKKNCVTTYRIVLRGFRTLSIKKNCAQVYLLVELSQTAKRVDGIADTFLIFGFNFYGRRFFPHRREKSTTFCAISSLYKVCDFIYIYIYT